MENKNGKSTANKVLGSVFAIFILAVVLKHFYGEYTAVQLFYFVMEAALVGGIADWFAVTALFKKPLGFPWHTAIIPKKRDEVIQAVVNMVETELLSPDALKQKLANVHFADYIVEWVDNQEDKGQIRAFLMQYTAAVLQKADMDKLAVSIENFLKAHTKNYQLTPLIHTFARRAVRNGKLDQWLDTLLDEIYVIAQKQETKRTIKRFLQNQIEAKTSGEFSWLKRGLARAAESLNALNIDDAADSLHRQLTDTVAGLKDPDNEFRVVVHQMISDMVNRLQTDPHTADTIEDWKNGVIGRVQLHDLLTSLLQSVTAMMNQPDEAGKTIADMLGIRKMDDLSQAHAPLLADWLDEQINTYWHYLKHNELLMDKVDHFLKDFTSRLIEKEYKLIGNIVFDTLTRFTDDDLNNFVADKVGEDLQWIRINGSVVGASAGFVIFMFVYFVYNPVIALFAG